MSTKRSHERGPSLSLRPHKATKLLEPDGSPPRAEEGVMFYEETDLDLADTLTPPTTTLWQNLQMISASDPVVVPPLQFLGRPVRPLTTFDISGITAWPSSLGIVRNQFYYNLTPQDGHLLPINVVNLTAWRQMASDAASGNPGPPVRAPYLHLGFAAWLKLDIFIFLPRLSLDHCIDGEPGRIQETVLEAWTDRIFLPAMYDGDARAPTSWARSNQNKTSTLWFDHSIASYPTYKIFTGIELDQIWCKAKINANEIAEFQDAYLVLHTEKKHSGVFTGNNPGMVFKDFEQAWLQEVDSRYIELGKDDLKISLSCDIIA